MNSGRTKESRHSLILPRTPAPYGPSPAPYGRSPAPYGRSPAPYGRHQGPSSCIFLYFIVVKLQQDNSTVIGDALPALCIRVAVGVADLGSAFRRVPRMGNPACAFLIWL